ncbi:MAG: ATP phosphoribosyltransferase [Anaerolineae bacterium]
MEPLTVALPKGRLQNQVLELFAAAGHPVESSALAGRKLIFYDAQRTLRFVLSKPADVPTYVEYGAADLGIVGEDVLRETEPDLYEPLGLGLGRCRLVLAGPPQARQRNLRLETNLRVASKYPCLALRYFRRLGVAAEIIPLSGSVELAPSVGLADLLVDLVETGSTLVENGLVELETIMESQAMLVVNRASHKLRFAAMQELIRGLAVEVERREGVGKVS